MKKTTSATITICSSANFYRHVAKLDKELTELGYHVLIPAMAKEMEQTGDFEVSHYKTWLADPGDYHKKAQLMHGHFDEVAKADAILVVNDEKHGVPNYIGGNVLMEMGLAFHLKQPVILLNDFPSESPYLEEIHGLVTAALHGNLSDIVTHLKS